MTLGGPGNEWLTCGCPACKTKRVQMKEKTVSQITDLIKTITEDAEIRGFGPTAMNFPWAALLMVSEVIEAAEEVRNGRRVDEIYYGPEHCATCQGAKDDAAHKGNTTTRDFEHAYVPIQKPEGAPVEMADVVIRALHWFGANGLDGETIIMEKLEYNRTRPFMHGGKTV